MTMDHINLKDNLIISNRGDKKITWNRYFYNKSTLSKEGMVWRCNKKSCRAMLHTEMGYWLFKSTLHDHIAEKVKLAHVLFMSNLKMLAIKGNESGRDIICNTLKTNCFQSNLGFSYNYAINTIQDIEKKSNFSFKEDYDITMEMRKTLG
ncbi:hypothetical protein DMUE_5284 [Dictyocoela muelleri]|nr:hypothetical protein DMUE_5284 [Dictyocoela muelleri]